MKNILLSVMLIMTFCVSGMQAQNAEDVDTSVDTVNVCVTPKEVVADTPEDASSSSQNFIPQPKTDNFVQADILVNKFKAMLDESKASETDDEPCLVPLGKKWFISQKIGISGLLGSDGDNGEENTVSSSFDQEEMSDEQKKNDSKINGGLSGEYTLSFVRGFMEDGKIKLNPLGIAFNTGVLFSFDKQELYGTTCDLMAKIGIEAGFGHKRGFGLDFLIGTGKSCGASYYLFADTADGEELTDDDFEIESEPYTAWCAKIGGQVWLRTGLFQAAGNSDVCLFVRYIYSKDPHKKAEFNALAFHNDWFEESWHVGITYFYRF